MFRLVLNLNATSLIYYKDFESSNRIPQRAELKAYYGEGSSFASTVTPIPDATQPPRSQPVKIICKH